MSTREDRAYWLLFHDGQLWAFDPAMGRKFARDFMAKFEPGASRADWSSFAREFVRHVDASKYFHRIDHMIVLDDDNDIILQSQENTQKE